MFQDLYRLFSKIISLLIIFISIVLSSNAANAGFPDDLSDVNFVHQNISSWPVTSQLDVSINSSTITLDYDKKNTWPNRTVPNLCSGCNANPWVVVNFDGQWWAATFEWFRFGQTTKPISVLHGDHIKGGPFGFTWQPRVGETYGFMVSGFARFPPSVAPYNAQERTNIQLYKWGVGPVDKIGPITPPPPPPLNSYTFTGEVSGTVSAELAGFLVTDDFEEDITLVVEKDRTLTLTIEGESSTTTINKSGRFNLTVNHEFEELSNCVVPFLFEGEIKGKNATGTVTASKLCSGSRVSLDATFSTTSPVEPVFEDNFSPNFLSPINLLLLD